MAVGYYDTYGTEQRVRTLENDLYMARKFIVELMPREIADSLDGYYSCHSREDYHRWKRETIDLVISKAEVDPAVSNDYEERGWCPLCKRGSRGPYASGFKMPGGLERHLTTFDGVGRREVRGHRSCVRKCA
jgi:hypothetical protein